MKQRKPARKTGSIKRKPTRAAGLLALVLPPECVIESAQALKSDLVGLMGRKTSVSIDATAVQRVDTASLQALVAFVRDRRAAELPFEWVGVPANLLAAAELLDLSVALGLESLSADAVAA